MSKKIYFIRHGESEGNTGNIRQTPETSLTKIGLKQAEVIAERLHHLNFDLLISSPHRGAQQTAEIISKKLKKEITTNDLFRERIRPSEQIGNNKDSKINIISEKEYNKAFISGLKYKDSESFEEIKTRAEKVLNFLDELPEENIVVVTHGMFLRIICAVLVLGELLDSKICFQFMDILKTKNTGITLIEKGKDDKWRLVTWNDQAHFAE